MGNMSKLRKSAKNRECLILLPHLVHDVRTTVLCHRNGGGMGMKHPDWMGAFGCDQCHAVVDNPTQYCREHGFTFDQIKLWFNDAIFKTQAVWIEEGLIVIEENGGE